jgi:hypothetical protein
LQFESLFGSLKAVVVRRRLQVTPEWLGAIGTGLSAIAAFMSVAVAYFIWRGQQNLAIRQQKLESDLAQKHEAVEAQLSKHRRGA